MKVLKPNTIDLIDGSFTRASTATYFDSRGVLQTAAVNVPRINYNRATGTFEGLLIEPQKTNLLLNSATLVTQTRTVTVAQHTLSFYGTGTVVLSGGHSATVVGNTNGLIRTVYTFVPSTTSLTLTVTGTVTLAQLETGTVTSYIPTTTSAVTRSADVVTGSNLIYSTVTNSESAWSSATTYSIGQKVVYNNKVYESLQNSNLNKTPDSFPLFWVYVGYDNKHAALDQSTSSGSTQVTEQMFIVKPGKVSSVALINIEANIIHISATDMDTNTVITAQTFGLAGGTILNWYDYFFNDPVIQRTQVVLTEEGMEILPNIVICVKLVNTTGVDTFIGSAVFGNITELGDTQYGASVGIVDYSKKATDEFGNTSLVQRPFSKRLSAQLYFPNTQLNKVQKTLYSVRAVPCVWIATQDPLFEEALVVYGFYRDFSTTISYPGYSLCRLEIEGLT